MDFHQKKVQETNELYEEHADTVEKLHAALRREIPLLTQEFQLSFAQVKVLELFMADKLTLFRYLRRNQFSLPVALSLLLDTIRWRITERIDELSITHVQDLLQKPLCFFNGFDRVGRPILIIQLRYFSAYENTDDLLAAVLPLIIYLLETTRKLTADLTKQRQKQSIPNPIISDLLLLVDFKDASQLPKDFSLVQTFIKVFKRYPGTAGMVNLLNFGWMYQGMWQMIKMILSQEAKSRVAFPKYKDLREMIDGSQLLAAFGGDDDHEWVLEEDEILAQYGRPALQPPLELEDQEVPSSRALSRRGSSSSLYFDSLDTWSPRRPFHHPQITPFTKLHSQPTTPPLSGMRKSGASMYGTPTGTLTPLPMAQFNDARPSSKRKPVPQQPAPPSGGTDGVSSWVLSQKLLALQEQQEEKQKQQVKAVATRNNPGAVVQWLLQWEQRIVFMLVRHRLWLYWLVILWVLFGRARLSTLWRQRTRLPALLARLSMLSAKRLT